MDRLHFWHKLNLHKKEALFLGYCVYGFQDNAGQFSLVLDGNLLGPKSFKIWKYLTGPGFLIS